jgi:hypothetical protein
VSGSPDLIVNALALVAALMALLPLNQARRGSAVAARLFSLHVGLVLLLAARLLAWSGSGLAAVPLMVAASWLPLLALRVAEQVVRRHAPAWVKWLALGGAIGFTIVSVLAGAFWSQGVLLSLAVFQAVAILCAVRLILASRGDVSPAEAKLAGIYAVALLVALPLSVTDFQAFTNLPVRGGAFAVLLLVLATSRFIGGTASWVLLLVDLAVLIAAGAILAGGAAVIWPESSATPLVRLGAIGVAVTALALIVQRRGEARLVSRARPSLVRALAVLPDRPDVDAVLSAHPLLASGRLVERDTLASYPPVLVDAMAQSRVLTRESGDAARDLLDAHAATHLLRLSRTPPRFLAVSAGGLGGDTLIAELDMVARVIGEAAA